ncbi:uncharacterized protein THITE_2025306, partial [Thermothielavioides terrestris NRRL 8126]
MASDEVPELSTMFATFIKDRPLRTYSHKGKNSRALSLPALRLDPDKSSVKHSKVRLNIFTSSISSPTRSRASWDSEESEDHEIKESEEEDDDDDAIILSQRPLERAQKQANRALYPTKSLRRRPFLIFDKTGPKGYKQLQDRPRPKATSKTSRYQPGDGFSGREARPSGSSLLTKNGMMSITGPHLGILDLTQSEPPSSKKKTSARRRNLEDNSFAPPPKKLRRPLQAKDPNEQ